MLACLQHQKSPVHHLPDITKILDTSVHHQSELRYPSVAELDAYAHRTADSPLSIKIFPTNIRVPQHKQINRTVNGLDTDGQRFGLSSHPFSAGHRGLLAIVKTPAANGGLKTSEGKRGKLSPFLMAVAPYVPPSNIHRLKSYDVEVPGALNAAMSDQSIVRHKSRPSNCSPAFLAATAASCSDSGFTASGSARVYARAVLPTQSADGHVEGLDYWQHRTQHRYTHSTYGVSSPEVCVPIGCAQLSYRPLSFSVTSGVPEKIPSSTLNSTMAPPWNAVLATPDTESYSQQEQTTGSSMDLHPHIHRRPQPYLTERSVCRKFPDKSSCQVSLLSSSLKSLECLISEIHPPCIKEQMLGRGYDTITGVTRLLDHQDAHIHLPVLR
nr:protein FAM222A isoform X1 [Misgurnus anguillicaudatus]XP_055063322.1 protein FAM222A isoform X1 [Misgurnus anguillicaudatus]